MEASKSEQAHEAEELGYSLELETYKFIGKAHKKQHRTFFLVHAIAKRQPLMKKISVLSAILFTTLQNWKPNHEHFLSLPEPTVPNSI